MSKHYIHYGSTKFDHKLLENQVRVFKNGGYITGVNKPHGLWASPINSQCSWKDWCLCEDFKTETLDESFEFNISEKANILHVHKVEDAVPYIIETPSDIDDDIYRNLDFPKLYAEFDGMELHIRDDWHFYRDSIFGTWDVDSLVVWNPAVIDI